jgi:toxin-antitoxin system PIN domain toxin
MLVDANLLLFAVDERNPRQEAAARWLSEQLAGAARIGLPWESLGAFLRLSTHPRIFERPLTPETATGLVREWLASEVVWTPLPTARHGEVLMSLVTTHRVTGNLITDARLAALAIEHGLTVYSDDSDFASFPEVRWINPLH